LNARRSPAHLRLIYGEFLELQVELALLRSGEVRHHKLHAYRVDDALRQVVRGVLPFQLTGAQKRVLKEIVDDLRSPHPMLRLLQGDVGSGKTIVAALALVVAAENRLQGAFMAPTELLAEQQHRGLERLLGDRYRVALLTGSRRSTALADLAAGRAQIAVGTHALIQEGVSFERLGLAVIDEQHRFGVAQRELLQRKGDRPDVLVMTATPIPRSLALTAYGDLALSVLDELPPGRVPVATRVAPEAQREEVYASLRRELDRGAQAYVVFPLIEGSQQVQAASIKEMGERVRRTLAPYRSAVVHGRTPPEQRETLLADFAAGRIRALVATTVIEVGIDVPNATLMVVDGAERFGLAQLHQLRGRVGRGNAPSTCIALHGELSEEAERRLRVFAETTDGFRIAEADLEIRGPGDLLGTRQSGLPVFRVANIVTDREWLERARSDAHELLVEAPREELLALLARLGPEALSRYDRFAGG
ncbi:MAG: ATP-dependent DNA helicase RecG, partial [Thermoanaerobaculia bacterium]